MRVPRGTVGASKNMRDPRRQDGDMAMTDDVSRRSLLLGLSMSGLATSASRANAQSTDLPDTVHFPSRDGHTNLIGYLFKPTARKPGRAPAMVHLHGRRGPYSILAHGRYDATTITQRHLFWARFWAARGCFVLVVDSFAPRGYPDGFAAGTHAQRPAEIDEVRVRPLDAYGGLQFLARHGEIDPARIGLQGWSNGASTALATMATSTLQSVGLKADAGFRAALAFYPGCGLNGVFAGGYTAYAPVQILIGTADEEVSPQRCDALVRDNRRPDNPLAITVYPQATHDFDDPGKKRQGVAANVAALADATTTAAAFMDRYLRL
jgi:dienelactone hydrolase